MPLNRATPKSGVALIGLKLVQVAGVRGGVTIANFGLFAAIGAVFGADSVGRYATYLAFVMMGGSLIAAGLPQMLMRRSAISANRHRKLAARLRSAYWLGWLITGSIGTALVAPVFFWLNAATELGAPLIGVAGPAAYSAAMTVVEELRGRGRPEAALIAEHAPTTLAPFAAIITLALLDLPEAMLIGALISAHIAAAALVCGTYVKAAGLHGRLKEAMRLLAALPIRELATMTAMRFLAACSGYLAILMVSIVADAALAGVIAIVLKLTGLASTFAAIVNSVYAARFGAARRNIARLRRLVFQTALLNGLGMSTVLAPMIVAPTLFLALFNVATTGDGSAFALRLVAASVMLRGFVGTPDLLFLVTGRAMLEVAALVASLTAMAALIVIVPPSAPAIAIAIAASNAVRFSLSAAGVVQVLRPSRPH